MTFSEAIKSGFSNYVTFSGRAARSEYWYWTLFVVLVAIVAGIADAVLLPGYSVGLFSPLASLGLLLPGLAVSVRRLHDRDYSGWWLLLIITGIGALLLLIWFCMRGTPGPNRFGPDPLAPA